MDWRQYISVCTPVAANGVLTFSLQTFDATPNISITIQITGVAAGTDEITAAIAIEQQINAVLATNFVTIMSSNGINYNGYFPPYSSGYFPPPPCPPQYQSVPPGTFSNINLVYYPPPKFSNEPFWPTFRVTRSDHIVCIWSQAQFRLSATSSGGYINGWNNIVQIAPDPTFITVEDAEDTATVMGVDFNDNDENPLTDVQIAKLMQIASSSVSRLINNQIVFRGCLHEETGNNTNSVYLRVRPAVYFDMPQIRRPYIIGITSVLITKSPVAFDLNRQTGFLTYRFSNSLVDISEPFDQLNEIKISYIAGNLYIPGIIKEKTVQAASVILEDDYNVKVLRGGSQEVEYFGPIETLSWIATELREFKLGY